MKKYELTLRSGGTMETNDPIVRIEAVAGVMWCYNWESDLMLAVPLSNVAYVITA